ncbi:MAG: methyl-accepting chemotaxis protein [Clostridiales bacterium]|nr:methyl-accepting chemotaxis protein [Clostridiales bacterium]
MSKSNPKNPNRERTSFLASIKGKIMILLVACVIVSVVVVMAITLPQMRSTLKNLSMNYMYDVTMTLGDEMELYKDNYGTDELLTLDTLTSLCEGVGIKGLDTSYAYVVAEDTTMLYHPTASKIGQPVENSVVLQVCGDLQEGKSVDNAVVEYYFNGSMRYAAYYVDPDSEFVLIISAEVPDVMATINRLLIMGIVSGIIIVVLVAIVGFFIATSMMRPFNEITEVVRKFADMDFSANEVQQKLDRRKDETGNMSRAVSVLHGKLVGMVSKLRDESDKLFKVSDSLNSNAGETANSVEMVERAVSEIADGAASQASDTQKATEAVIEIGEMMEETSGEMSKLIENATEMKESSDEASATLSQLDQINKRARQAIDVIYEQTNTTNESAQKIREATSLISSIAEETNLLSLNASIEAARAGEQGRGFAVVATQIQKLAEQSSASAQKIENITDSLIEDSEKAVQTMASVQDIMAEQSDHVAKTDEIFGRVKEGIDNSIEGVSRIAEKTQQMDGARASVVDVVQSLTAIAEENAASTEETTASVTEVGSIVGQISDNATVMKDVADELEQSMSVFKL